jgi:CRP-like cAMP-binding protein
MPRNELQTAEIEAVPQAFAIGAPRAWKGDASKDLLDVLSGVPLFEGLSKRHLRGIAKAVQTIRYSPGRPIVEEGTPGNTFFVILDGQAKVVRSATGSSVLEELGPGGFFGELALLDGGPRAATVIALTKVETLRLSRNAFRRLVVEEPQVGLRVMETLAKRLREVTDAMAG